MTGRALVGVLATGALLAPTATADARPGTAAEGSPPPLATFVDHDRFFSPNGDGAFERAHFVYRLDKRAQVTILVRDHASHVVRRARLGSLESGRHAWAWNGKDSGHTLPDGSYEVELRAERGSRESRVSQVTTIVTHPDDGKLVLSRPTVYPQAAAVDDRLRVVYLRAGYSPYAQAYPELFGDDIPLHARLVVKNSGGSVVYDVTRGGYRPAFLWSARDETGDPLPPGTHRLRVAVTDKVGNTRVLRSTAAVSAAQLVAHVWTTTVAAADAAAAPTPLYDPSCNGCGETCGPVPSTRFPGGLSFLQPCSFGYAALKTFGATPPVTPAPVDTYRVAATGGPTVPGDTDVAKLGGVTLGPGDVTVSTPWQGVDLIHYPWLPDQAQPVTWEVSTDSDNDYDIASFTVEYQYYEPAP